VLSDKHGHPNIFLLSPYFRHAGETACLIFFEMAGKEDALVYLLQALEYLLQAFIFHH